MIILIACIDMNNGIGDANGNLLYHLPNDLKHFKDTTFGKKIIMGRKTWDSLSKKPLIGRENYVLSRDASFNPKGATVLGSVEEVLELSETEDVYVIGGENVYNQFMPYADKMILTHVIGINQNAIAYFPDYETKEWKPVGMTKHSDDDKHTHAYTVANYIRKYKNK